ncbi:hypothetical protein, partial [Pseudomonas viridiflava]|uniref:hypothetical protein n=1 Tax=Pseudomonas viridiflava TaxID=33069 RepID=UPI00197C86D1
IELIEPLFLITVATLKQHMFQCGQTVIDAFIIRMKWNDIAPVLSINVSGDCPAILQGFEAKLDHLTDALFVLVARDHQDVTIGDHEHRSTFN